MATRGIRNVRLCSQRHALGIGSASLRVELTLRSSPLSGDVAAGRLTRVGFISTLRAWLAGEAHAA